MQAKLDWVWCRVRKFAVFWALGGVSILLIRAISRVAPIAWDALQMPLGPVHWIVLSIWILISMHAEGYRGFQKRFVPRVVSRAFALPKRLTPLRFVFAPAFAMGLFHCKRRPRIVAWCVSIGVTLLVVAMRYVPQPWRGIVDAGVVVGLGWGLVALLVQTINAVKGTPPEADTFPEPA